ncbi:MAG: hypothetical protein ABIB93_07680 [Chloroflexota bacterium]
MKKCPNCGQMIEDAAFKCSQCHQWVDNEVFAKIGAEDVRLIKEKDLIIYTPGLLAAYITNFFLTEDLKKQVKKPLGEKPLFNLFVFYSFCYFYTARLHVGAKQGCRDMLMEMLKRGLLQGIVQLFIQGMPGATLLESLHKYGEALYQSFDTVMDGISLEADAAAQIEAAQSLDTVVFGDERPDWLENVGLYRRFWVTVGEMNNIFSRMFLVEEADFDWRSAAGL